MNSSTQAHFDRWYDGVERRHTGDLSFTEIRRACQALSDLYVRRRTRLEEGKAFASAGKRAAYALYFAPLHTCALAAVFERLDVAPPSNIDWLDLGCGTGAGSAALAISDLKPREVTVIDRSGWALEEFKASARSLRLPVHTLRGRLEDLPWPKTGGILAGWSLNELCKAGRAEIAHRFRRAALDGSFLLIAEPIARRPLPWWESWTASWAPDHAQEQQWKIPFERPERIAAFDHATRLDHRILRLRTLCVPGNVRGASSGG